MTFTSKLSTFVGAFVFAGSVSAAQEVVCPSIDAIKAEGVVFYQQLFANFYLTYQLSSYNTDTEWTFVLAPIEGDSAGEAIENGNAVLSTMTEEAIPGEEEGVVVCEYESGSGEIFAAAVGTQNLISPAKIKQIIKLRHKH
jgi:hypothetical protein